MKKKKESNVMVEVKSGDEDHYAILYDGVASYKEVNNALILQYTDEQNVLNKVRFSSSSCIISRKGDEDIKIHLSVKGESYIEVKTEFGVLRFPVDAELIFCQDDYMQIQYSLPNNPDEYDVSFQFSWKIKGHLS